MIINLDFSEWWAERLVRSNKGCGEASRTPREICAHFWSLQMCEAVKRLAWLEGPRGRGAQSRCCPYGSAPTLPILIILSLMWNSTLFQKSKASASARCRTATLCLPCGFTHSSTFDFSVIFWTWIYWGVLYNLVSVYSLPFCLRLPLYMPGCSNKYDKWGYRCLQNELWSESLWCLTLLMKYLDESMYSHFVLRVTHCFAIEHILFLF